MKLPQFILVEMESILVEWEVFAAAQLPAAANMKSLALRDHAQQILEAVVADITLPQTNDEQLQKSMGRAMHAMDAPATAAQIHAILRLKSGFDINQLIAEYRALRASVLRLWAKAVHPSAIDLPDLVRFNEAIDQALTESIAAFSAEVDAARILLTGMLGHDMRSPLQTILMVSALLLKLDAGEKVANAAQRLASSGRQLQGLMDDLLDFNRAQLGLKITIAPAMVDLNEVLEDQVQQLRTAFPDRSITWLTSGPVEGFFDSKRIHQLSSNLISNAVKYGFSESTVHVALSGALDNVLLTVKNSGRPIDASILRSIFEPLQRGVDHDETRQQDSSLGLGLYISREIAAAHGGTIEVHSDTAETIFSVRLPKHRAEPSALELTSPTPAFRRRPPSTTEDPIFLTETSGCESVPHTEIGALFRAKDWSRTSLGPIVNWPESLRVAVSICLNSRFPMFVWWGPALVNIYNDAYIPLLGKRHPAAFGQPAKEVWESVWTAFSSQISDVMRHGRASWNDRVCVTVERNGYPEEAFFTWSYSPIFEEGGKIGGLFCAVTEETRHVAAERESKLLLGRV